MRATLGILLGAALLAACGGARTDGSGGTVAPSRNSSVISASELTAANVTNLYDAVQRLRPQWLRRQRSTMMLTPTAELVVYLDRTAMGGPDALKQIRPTDVVSIRYYSPSEAEAEFGLGNLNGAIQVVTRRP